MLGLQLVPSADLLESISRLLSRIFNSLAPKEGSGVGALSGCKMPETEAGRRLDCTTVLGLRMAHMKWTETKQLPNMLPGPAAPGCCLLSFQILWAILSTGTVLINKTPNGGSRFSDFSLQKFHFQLSVDEISRNCVYTGYRLVRGAWDWNKSAL